MSKLTNYEEAEAIRNDILTRNPEGCRIGRGAFDKLLVAGYRKSLQAAKRITATGEAAGFWNLERNPHAHNGLQGWVLVHPAQGSISIAATVVLGQPKTR